MLGPKSDSGLKTGRVSDTRLRSLLVLFGLLLSASSFGCGLAASGLIKLKNKQKKKPKV
jgi:hypothetical protein